MTQITPPNGLFPFTYRYPPPRSPQIGPNDPHIPACDPNIAPQSPHSGPNLHSFGFFLNYIGGRPPNPQRTGLASQDPVRVLAYGQSFTPTCRYAPLFLLLRLRRRSWGLRPRHALRAYAVLRTGCSPLRGLSSPLYDSGRSPVGGRRPPRAPEGSDTYVRTDRRSFLRKDLRSFLCPIAPRRGPNGPYVGANPLRGPHVRACRPLRGAR